MKKGKKLCSVLALVMALVCLLGIPAGATNNNNPPVTIDKVVAIDEYNIVVEFSEGIALNKNGSPIGPWIAIRICHKDTFDLLIENDKPMQIGGTFAPLSDGKYNRWLYTIDANNNLGVETLEQLLDYEGDLVRFKEEYDILFCIEEIHYRTGTVKDYYVENVSNIAGTAWLEANTEVKANTTYEGNYSFIEKDYDYVLYPEDDDSEESSSPGKSNNSSTSGSQSGGDEGGDGGNLLWYIIGGAVLAVIVVVIIVVAARKKKQS